MTARRTCILVIGMHRSGASALARHQPARGLLDAWRNSLTRPLVDAKNKQDADHLPFMLVGSRRQSKIARLLKALTGKF